MKTEEYIKLNKVRKTAFFIDDATDRKIVLQGYASCSSQDYINGFNIPYATKSQIKAYIEAYLARGLSSGLSFTNNVLIATDANEFHAMLPVASYIYKLDMGWCWYECVELAEDRVQVASVLNELGLWTMHLTDKRFPTGVAGVDVGKTWDLKSERGQDQFNEILPCWIREEYNVSFENGQIYIHEKLWNICNIKK